MQTLASPVSNQGCNADYHYPGDGVSGSTGPPPASQPSSSSFLSLPCPECGQTFRRREHLSRHLDRHSGRRSHKCAICKLSFSRRDTLKRHVGTHGAPALAEWTQSNARFAQEHHYRACEACAKAKQRCDGRRPAPCTNCTNKNRPCSYPPNPGDEQTTPVEQPTADNTASDSLPLLSQPFAPWTPLSCISGQPQIEPGFTWDINAQFLLPFSPVLSLGPGTSSGFCFGDAGLAAADQPADGQRTQNGFVADAVERGALNAGDGFLDQDHLTAEEDDILTAENIPHIPPLTAETRAYMIQAIQEGMPPNSEGKELAVNFPSLRHLDTYMQLYFEHFHPRMPLLHVPTFEASPETWQLVLSIVCLGCRYSQSHHHEDHLTLLQRLAQSVLRRELREILHVNILTHAQAHLLFQQTLWLSGDWSIIVEAQCYRNFLVTLCRMLLSREGTLMHMQTSNEDVDLVWSHWVQAETKRRLIHFIYMFECLYATFHMIPPLLSTSELTAPVPASDSYWSSSREQWHLLPFPQPSSSICALLASIGLGDVAPASLEPLTRSAILFSALMQQTAESDLLEAMRLRPTVNPAGRPTPSSGMLSTISQRAFEALIRDGCSHVLRERNTSTSLNDYALLSRVLSIISFTPLSLLFSYEKWQSTDMGQSTARSKALSILLQNVPRARRCLYYAAQTLQFFRTARIATTTDIMCVLVSVVFIVLYVDIVVQQDSNFAGCEAGVKTSSTDIIRLDQVIDGESLDDWLQVRDHKRPHVSMIGLLDSTGSRLRVYKEGSRILATGSPISKMAMVISVLLEFLAKGYPPTIRLENSKDLSEAGLR